MAKAFARVKQIFMNGCSGRRVVLLGWLTHAIPFEYNALQERAMPKPTTDEIEPATGAPDAPTAPRWVLPDNFRDVTAERIGERIALVGPPQRAKPKG
jgi:hypothetical protein